EIGTSNGYSALHLVKNLKEDSVLTTIEVDDKRFEIAKKNFEETKTESVIKQVKREIFELIENNIFEKPFDLVFIDAAHKHYEKLFEKLQEKNLFAKNATIIFDNVISHSYMKQFIETMTKKYQTIVIELGGGFLVVNL